MINRKIFYISLEINKIIIILTFLMSYSVSDIYSQIDCNTSFAKKPTSVGIVIYSNDVETVWNAIRFANFCKSQNDTVNIFLLGKGVELDNLVKTNNEIKDQTDDFIESGGTILGCGTCLQSRNNNEPKVCKFSSMQDLYDIIRKNKIVMTF
jgi:uncharacterized protein involved in oxidation of intracellular sulfur